MRVQDGSLRTISQILLRRAGCSDAEAIEVADHVVDACLKGHDSHGVIMIPRYIDNARAGLLNPNRHATLIRETAGFAIFDGDMGFGQVVAREAMDWAVTRASAMGTALFALRNVHHVGRVGTYGEQAASQGMIAILFVNAVIDPPRVAPYAGKLPRFGTNPICFAIPATAEQPATILDFATSRLALGKIRVAVNAGRQLPIGVAIDAEGQPTTDPAVLVRPPFGAALPFGEYKGSGLMLVTEILAGILTGGGTIHPKNSHDARIRNGVLGIVIDPAQLVDQAYFDAELDALLSWVKSSPPTDPSNPVLIAGDPERIASAERGARGIDVDAGTWASILRAADTVGVPRATIEALTDG